MIRRTLAVGLLAVALSSSVFGADTPAAGAAPGCGRSAVSSGTIELDVPPLKRLFLLRLPDGYDGKSPRPVIVVFHGFTMNAHLMESLADFAAAWPEAVVVYPQGLPRRFEAMARAGAQPGWQISTGELDDRDLSFFDALVGWLRRNLCVEDRVFVSGYSNGAYFANLLGCERASLVAGVAAASGGATCAPKEPRPVIITHGTRDPVLAYDQGVVAASAWAHANRCAEPPKAGAPACAEAKACSSALVFCTVDGGHEYDRGFARKAAELWKAERKQK